MYIVSIDQSTTGTKVGLVEENGMLLDKLYMKHKTFYFENGHVEQDAEEVWDNTQKMLKLLAKKYKLTEENTAALGVTCQTGAFLLWDTKLGKAKTPLIGWQCNRGSEICDEMGEEQRLRIEAITGMSPDGTFPAAKLAWILRENPHFKEEGEKGELIFGTVDTWLLWKLTKGKVYATDCGNASVSQMMDLQKQRWSQSVLDYYQIPLCILPEIKDSDEILGTVELEHFPAIPIAGNLGDSNAALFFHKCFKKGQIKITYGTGVSVLVNAGHELTAVRGAMYPVAAWKLKKQVTYAYEGTIFNAGSFLDWLVKEIKITDNVQNTSQLAALADGNGNVYFVPALSGLGTPYWNSSARGMIMGLGLNTSKEQIVRAALEGIAYQVYDILEFYEKSTGQEIQSICCDGGLSANQFLMEFQSMILDKKLTCSEVEEGSLLGAAYLAGINVGIWDSPDGPDADFVAREAFEYKISQEKREKLIDGWHRAIEKVLK